MFFECNFYYSSNGVAAAYVKENGISQLYYLHTDHLGSITTITNSIGNKDAEYSFDVWGNRRNAHNWELTNSPDQSFTNRGFTGHVSEANILQGEAAAEYPAELIPIAKRIGEHIDEFGLTNMNGRIYDLTIGMFLSPDNYVQMPDFSAGFNRYAYTFNNPLKYTDPSGENPALWLFVGTTFYLVGKHIQIEATYGDMDNSWKQVGDILTMGGSLFLAAGASSAIGAAFGGVSDWWYWRSIMNETMRASAHGYFSWIQAHTMGGGHEPDAAFISGFVGSAAGSAVGMTMWPGGSSTEMAVGLGTSTLTSGLSAELSGGDFGKGMVSGVRTMVFNHMAHGIWQELKDIIYDGDISGVSVGFNVSLPNTETVSGLSVSYFKDANSNNRAIAITKLSNPKEPGVDLSFTIERISIISNNSDISINDLRGKSEVYSMGFYQITYTRGGIPDYQNYSGSPYTIKSLGFSLGFPVTASEYECRTTIIPLSK